ncbi:uncharacterized protein LOC118495625 [Sander lucioperca]|uniref:uncharacterized protein LOC118495625 n=1 Tax=Sander lucioperca TaxID=283035 RepID=UPI001653D10A|nr:uncharacterized protein LOC118495625 [Sander lucioperca]
MFQMTEDPKILQMEENKLKTDQTNLQTDQTNQQTDQTNQQEELDELKDVMSAECFKSAQRLVESCRNQTPPDLKDLQQIFSFILQTSDKGPKNSERSEESSYNAKTSSSSSSSSSWTKATVKVFPVVTGQTFGADQVILEQVENTGWSTWKVEITRNLQECDIIIIFCPIRSRVGSDVEAAMREDSVSSGGKPVILVLMHHTRDPDYSTSVRRWSETFQNVVLDVHVLFHETQRGLLLCSRNDRAVKLIQEELKKRSKDQAVPQKQEELKKRSKDQAVPQKQEELKKRSKDQAVPQKQEELKKRSKDQAVPPKQDVKKYSSWWPSLT